MLHDLRKLSALAPAVFIAHVIEEAPGFVAWFNSHVNPDITPSSFWQVNITALVITLAVSAVAWFDTSGATVLLTVAWLSFLMAANAVLHIAGAIVDRSYVPGLITAIVLYLPYYALVVRLAKRHVSLTTLLVTAAVSSMPMLVHGYRIVFLGSRLF